MRIPKHTCADELISIEDDAAWKKAMETRKTCPACQYKRGIMESAQALGVSVDHLINKITENEERERGPFNKITENEKR